LKVPNEEEEKEVVAGAGEGSGVEKKENTGWLDADLFC